MFGITNLNAFQRVDLGFRGAENIFRSTRRDLHQVQEPFAIFVGFRPMDVKGGSDRRPQRLPQVDDLKEKFINYSHKTKSSPYFFKSSCDLTHRKGKAD